MPYCFRSSRPDLQWAFASVSMMVSMSEEAWSVAMSANICVMNDLKLRSVLEGGRYASMIAIDDMDVSVLWRTRSSLSA